jgi:hypothetical protein
MRRIQELIDTISREISILHAYGSHNSLPCTNNDLSFHEKWLTDTWWLLAFKFNLNKLPHTIMSSFSKAYTFKFVSVLQMQSKVHCIMSSTTLNGSCTIFPFSSLTTGKIQSVITHY